MWPYILTNKSLHKVMEEPYNGTSLKIVIISKQSLKIIQDTILSKEYLLTNIESVYLRDFVHLS